VIASEGRSRKFIDKVKQITFSGAYAADTGQPVYYVTERCVFQRTPRARVHEIEGCGHAPPLMSPEQIRAVAEFINS